MDHLLVAIEEAWTSPVRITLEFSKCSFISAEGAAVISSLKLRRDKNDWVTNIDWSTVSAKIDKQFVRWNLSRQFGRWSVAPHGSAVPILHQWMLREAELVAYVERWIIKCMPTMTNALAKHTRRSLCEVFVNVFQHAESPIGGLAIGQVYSNVRQFQLCVCDGGVGIVHRVQSAGFGLSSPADAIRWALVQGNSTAQRPGGLGLSLLREFVIANNGVFRIYTNNGCLVESAGRRYSRTMAASFPGTLIVFRLNNGDEITYDI